jgi:3,4-dihydroxy 2-butanone 4-phosphate synthase / GTP cyclohydrolase II
VTATSRRAHLETTYGPVEFWAFSWDDEPPYAVLRSLLDEGGVPRLRIQAQCLTSTAFHSTMCDCGHQIDTAVRMCAEEPDALLVYLPQEGRGHGLLSKVEIMVEQNRGRSLREAQHAVGRPDSRLSFHRVPEILERIGFGSRPVHLVTGSAAKLDALRALGVAVAGHGPLETVR